MKDTHRYYQQKLVNFLVSRNNFLRDETLQNLSRDDKVNIGDIIFEVCHLSRSNEKFDIVAYKLSAERNYLEGDSTYTSPDSQFYTEVISENSVKFNGAFGIDFRSNDSIKTQPLPSKIGFIQRKDKERYLHTSIRIDSNTLSSGRFFRLNTPEKDCTYDLVARVVGYIPQQFISI